MCLMKTAKKVLYRKFLIEKDAKNEAYDFILTHNLIEPFIEFCKKRKI